MLENFSSTNLAKRFVEVGKNISVEELCGDLKSRFGKLSSKFIPKKTISNQPKWRHKAFPINQETRTALQDKYAIHRIWFSNRYNEAGIMASTDFTHAHDKVRRLLRKSKPEFERYVAKNSKDNPKLYSSYSQRKLKTKREVASLLEDKEKKDSLTFDDEEKVNILCNKSSSVFSIEPKNR